MALVMIVTRDVADRYRGFLASIMLEVAPAVYVSPRMYPGVSSRTWDVLSSWHSEEPRGSITMVWRDVNETGGVGIESLGEPPRQLVEVDGTWLVKKML